MKKTFLLLIIFTILSVANAQDIEKNNHSILRCAANVRAGFETEAATGQQFDYEPFIDTLYRYLYSEPVEVDESYIIFGKITLQAYFIEKQDDRVNYEDLYYTLHTIADIDGMHDVYFYSCAAGLADYCVEEEYYTNAIEAYQWALKATPKVFGNNAFEFDYEIYFKLMGVYLKKKDYQNMLKCDLKQLEIVMQYVGSDERVYFDNLQSVATAYSIVARPAQADSCLAICQNYLEKHRLTDSEEYVEVLLDRADANHDCGRTDIAVEMYQTLMTMIPYNSEDYYQLLFSITEMYYGDANYDKSMVYFDKTLKWMDDTKIYTPKMIKNLTPLCYSPNVGKQVLHLRKLAESVKDENDIPSLEALICTNAKCLDYQQATYYADKLIAIYDGYIASGNDEMANKYAENVLNAMSAVYNFSKIYEIKDYYFASCERQLGENHRLCVEMMALVAGYCDINGQYRDAIEIYDVCLNNTNEEDLIRKLKSEKMSCELGIGNYSKAIEMAQDLMQGATSLVEQWRLRDYIAGATMADYEIKKYNPNEIITDETTRNVIDVERDFLAFSSENFPAGHPYMLNAQLYLASTLALAGEKEEALKIIDLYKNDIMNYVKNETMRKEYLSGVASVYLELKMYREALQYIDEDALNHVALFEERNLTTMMLSEAYRGIGNMKKAQEFYTMFSNDMIEQTKRHFSSLSDETRNSYWKMYQRNIYDAGKYLKDNDKQSEFAGIVYDLTLFSKGLLLNSSLEFKRLVNDSGNAEIIALYDQLCQIRTTLESNRTLTKEAKEKLEIDAENIEYQIVAAIKEYGDINHYLATGWNEIREALKQGEMAIEFIDYCVEDTISCYGALLLKNDMKEPLFVKIGEKKVIDAAFNPKDRDFTALGEMIWRPLAKHLDGAKTIYFSPAGTFNIIPVEYLALDGKLMSENYTMSRLSSTREIVRDKAETDSWHNAVVYGGIEYDVDLVTLNKEDEMRDDIINLPYLEGTLNEAKGISKVLTNKGLNVDLITDVNATEESFKALSGKDIQLIHIGTHGYFYNDGSTNLRDVPSLQIGTMAKSEDKSMYRSGLYMAGSNISHKATDLADNNDGILTAKEVSLLDLHHVDLAVLSACSTAYGEIDGEGVFGLQRGMKLAGVKTILMSAWPVSDAATQILMEEFFKNITLGQTKHEALKNAQNHLRTVNDGKYSDPKYWAAFIMLD